MKQLVLLTAVLLCLTGCSNKQSTLTSETASEEPAASEPSADSEIYQPWNEQAEALYHAATQGMIDLEASGNMFCDYSYNAIFSKNETYSYSNTMQTWLTDQITGSGFDLSGCEWIILCNPTGYIEQVYVAETESSALVGGYPLQLNTELSDGIYSLAVAPQH